MIGKQTCRVSLTREQARRALQGRRQFPDLGDESSELIVPLTEREKAALGTHIVSRNDQAAALESALRKVEAALDATT